MAVGVRRVLRIGNVFLDTAFVNNSLGVEIIIYDPKTRAGLQSIVSRSDLVYALAELFEDYPEFLLDARFGAYLPIQELAGLLHSISAALRRSGCIVRDHCDRKRTGKAVEAAKKAALLIDIAAMLIDKPETVDMLPEDVKLLVRKHEEGTLFSYIGDKSGGGGE